MIGGASIALFFGLMVAVGGLAGVAFVLGMKGSP